jgi:hypothetical protein
MNDSKPAYSGERGGAAVKFLCIGLVLVLIANGGIQYIPIAYNGASFRQEMDTAVVKGLAASGRMKPMDIVTASVQKAAYDYDIPNDAFVEIKPEGGVVMAHVVYSQKVPILPFGIYNHEYKFDHKAAPTGYLLKDERKP